MAGGRWHSTSTAPGGRVGGGRFQARIMHCLPYAPGLAGGRVGAEDAKALVYCSVLRSGELREMLAKIKKTGVRVRHGRE